MILLGQSLIPVMNPVVEGDDYMGRCTRPSGNGAILVYVNGVEGLVIVDYSTQTPLLTSFTYPNVTRSDI